MRRAIVVRVPMSEDLIDEDFAALAAASFRALDEEKDGRGGWARSAAAGGLWPCAPGGYLLR